MKHRRVKIFISIIFLVILNVVPTYASDIFIGMEPWCKIMKGNLLSYPRR